MSTILSYSKQNVHHTTESETDACPSCCRPKRWFWKDEDHTYGYSETYHGQVGKAGVSWECIPCYEKRTGEVSIFPNEINEEQKRPIKGSAGSGSS